MAQDAVRSMTAEDLLAMPSGNGERYELIEGELIVAAAAGGKHGVVAGSIFTSLALFLSQSSLGRLLAAETGFYTRADDRTVRAPDVAFIRNENIPDDGLPDGYIRIVPDLVVEVVSPNDRADEVKQKVQEWLDFGVLEAWVAYPSTKQLEVYRHRTNTAEILKSGDTLTGSGVLSGFKQPLDALFT